MNLALPHGFHTVTPRIFVDDPVAAVEFLRTVFDATGEVPRPTARA
jgi:PhnB protein